MVSKCEDTINFITYIIHVKARRQMITQNFFNIHLPQRKMSDMNC
jgi:hypothetical protein